MSDCNQFSVGSPEWRDCQERQFNEMITYPELWQFDSTTDQIKKISDAYQKFKELSPQEYPDPDTIRVIISNTEFPRVDDTIQSNEEGSVGRGPQINVKEMFNFWAEFSSDMPAVLKQHAGLTDLQLLWITNKIKSVLLKNNLPYISWEEKEIVAHVKVPASLKKAADLLEYASNESFLLYHHELQDDMLTWNLKRGHVVPEKITSIAGAPIP